MTARIRTRWLPGLCVVLLSLLIGCGAAATVVPPTDRPDRPPSPTVPPATAVPVVPTAVPTTAPPPLPPVCLPEDAAVDTADWQVYADPAGDYRVRYPGGWRVAELPHGVGFGPQEMGEDIQWGLFVYDESETSVAEIIRAVGQQFEPDRSEARACITFGGVTALKVTVTTSRMVDWYAEAVIVEHEGRIFHFDNGAMRDDRFPGFYASIEFASSEMGMSPPAGLVYRTAEGVWRVESDGQSTLLSGRAEAVLSPEALRGTGAGQGLFGDDDDVWVVDLASGEERNLTGEAGRQECCPLWWPARPGVILFGSWPRDAWGPSSGFLSAVDVDGGEYRVLDEEVESFALPAPAPDGQTIAYDRAGTSWLYDWDGGPEPFDTAQYDLVGSGDVRIASPAWSPDGKRLAWVVGGGFGPDGGWQIGVAVFDLEGRSAVLLHPYDPVGVGGWPAAPVWSPDGRWLAYSVWPASDPAEAGLWVLRADGSEEYHVAGQGSGAPVWSSDGRWLAFRDPAGTRLVEVGTWQPTRLDLPPDAVGVAWIVREE